MKLQTKFALYNAFSKIMVILFFSALLPIMVEHVIYLHIDERLNARKEKVLKLIQRVGLNQILLEEDSSFGSYTLLKDEFISIELDSTPQPGSKIENAKRNIEDDIFEYRVLSHNFVYEKQIYLLEIGEGLSKITKLNHALKEFVLWLMIAFIVVFIVLDIVFSNIVLKPFKRIIQKKLRNTKHPASFNFKAIKTNTDDFRYLDQSINEMMLKMKDVFLKEKEFIGNVSHELLTPISILQNRFENILSEKEVPHQFSLKIIESQKTLSRLSKIIKTLLLISNIENAQYLKEDEVNLKNLVAEVVEEIEDRLSDKKITLENHCKEDFIFKNCNKSLLFTLFFNIINNAIKYNKPNGSIIIKGFHNEENYCIEIKDTGVGIEKENIENIFNRFKRFNKKDEESYGLGLPIVKTIADFHHIKIDVHSVGRTGTSFQLFFNNFI